MAPVLLQPHTPFYRTRPLSYANLHLLVISICPISQGREDPLPPPRPTSVYSRPPVLLLRTLLATWDNILTHYSGECGQFKYSVIPLEKKNLAFWDWEAFLFSYRAKQAL